VGTLNYMSPEQVSRGQVDARSDVYSLGATLYEVLTLRPPFERGNEHETQRAILFEEPIPPRKLNPHLNRDIETVILHALEKNPEKRYASAGDLAADLKRFLRYEPIRARPLTALTRIGRRIWRRRAAVAAAAAIAVLLVALGSVLLWSGHKDRLRRIAEYEPRVLREVLKLQLGSLLRPSASARAELDPAGLASRRDLDALAASSGLDPVEEATRGLADAAAEVPERPEAYYHRARGLDLLGRDEEALAEAGRALERDAGFVPALVLRAALLEKQGKQAEALAERERAKKLGQGGWAEIWLSAHEARGAERWEETAEAFQKLIDLEGSGEAAYLGSSIESRLGRASALLESRRFDDAIIELKVAKGLWRKAAEPDLLLGKAYYLMGNEVGAEAALLDLWKRAQSPDEAALAIASMYQGFQRSDKGLEWIERVSREGLKARNRALFLGSIGRWKEAAESARRATEIDPRDARAWANLGLALFTLRRIVPAEDAVRKAIEIDPEEAGPHDILGMILERWGKLEEARLEIAKALEKDPGHAQALTHLGFVLERQGQPEEAERCYRKAVRLEPGPGKSGLHYGLSFFLHRHGRLEELIDSLKEAVRRDPRDAIAQSHLAISLVDGAHDIVELGEATRKAVALDSRNPFTLNILYLVLSAEGKPKEALEVQKKNTELGSNNPVMWSNLGNACRGAGKLDEAATAYRRSLSIDPAGVSAFVAHVNLCDVLLNQGKLWEEIRALQEALLRDPEDPILASQRGIALEPEGSHEEASEAFLQATRLDPTFALAHMHLGNCYAALRKPAEAEASYKKAVELQFGGGPGLLLQTALGDFYGSQGKLDLAIESYRKALASSPNPFIAPTGSLANFLHTRGKLGEALALYAREIRWFPVDGEVGFEANLWSILRNEKDIPGVGRELDGILNILEAAERWKPEDMGRPLKSLALFWLHHPERRDLAKALDYARRALKEGKPDDPEAYLVLAEAYALSGRLADAVLTLEKAMRLEHATGNITGWLEKYRSAVLPDLLSPASIDRAVAALDLETLVAAGAEWRFFRGKREPCEQLGWTAPGFDDGAESGWEKGPSGFGFGDNDDRTTLDDMLESYTTVYIRRRFQVPDPAAFRRLVLSVRVDDGFVAYLNGEEVGRSRAPGEPGAKVPFDAAATGYVPDWEDIEVSIDPKNLRAGENLLAIQGLNNSKSSSDLSLVPVLEAERPPDPARDAKLVADFRAAARGDDAPARLAYLEGRLRQRAGKPDEAAGKLAEAASALKGSPEPVIRLAESLRAAGRPAEARDRLAGALRSVHRGEKRVWNLWLQVLLVDLRLAPADILAALPAASAEATDRLEPYADDIHWLLERLKENQPVRIDCGATRESSGGWGSDRFYESGNREEESYPRIETLYVGEIAGTEEDALYRTDRLFLPEELRPPAYRVPLPPGSYSVTLHFAERWFVKPGTRVFDVLLEGKKVLERHDPFARVGPATADRETLRGVRVDDGILDIELRARTDNPSIAAIEIAPER
jgi:tetratricopeptide (TPR) repeat protein